VSSAALWDKLEKNKLGIQKRNRKKKERRKNMIKREENESVRK
jgi:hypothetical protein